MEQPTHFTAPHPYQVPTPALTPALTPKSKATPQSVPLDLNSKPAKSLVPLKRGNDKVTTHPSLYQHNKYNADDHTNGNGIQVKRVAEVDGALVRSGQARNSQTCLPP